MSEEQPKQEVDVYADFKKELDELCLKHNVKLGAIVEAPINIFPIKPKL